MPTKDAKGFWNLTVEDLKDENLNATAQAIFNSMSRSQAKRIATQKGIDILTDVEIAKADEHENLVFGWASVAFTKDGTQVLDRQGHAIDVEDLESAAYDFTISGLGSGDMHSSEGFGELVESMVFTDEKIELLGLEPGSVEKGWWVGFRVPPEYHEQVRNGQRTMFSIEGTAKLEPFSD